MSDITIKTLTPIHIGSGVVLQNNTDFVSSHEGEDTMLYVIDDRKLLKLIGDDKMQYWLASIENREDTKKLLENLGSGAHPSQYCTRDILCFSNVIQNETLKEQIHNGLGLPYIPGSSIKGAIRTVILSYLSKNIENKENKVLYRGEVNASVIEKELFGKDPQRDIFRFIHVGDAYFEKGSEIALRMININYRERNDLLDRSKSQLIEAIGIEVETKFKLDILEEYYDFAKSYYASLGNLPKSIRQINDLFILINKHTRQLLESEYEYWSNADKEGADDYIENIGYILEEIKKCVEGKSCVLRIGHGSGWRFITGAWSQTLKNFKTDIVPRSRPNNSNYKLYNFPKTRRLGEGGDILGFVKLTL